MNIEIAPDVSLSDLRGKPFTLVCEIDVGPDEKPFLKSRHAYKILQAEKTGVFRLEREA